MAEKRFTIPDLSEETKRQIQKERLRAAELNEANKLQRKDTDPRKIAEERLEARRKFYNEKTEKDKKIVILPEKRKGVPGQPEAGSEEEDLAA